MAEDTALTSFFVAFLIVFIVISGVAAFFVEHHFVVRDQVKVARVLFLGCLVLAVLYVLVRQQVAMWLASSPRGTDAMIVLLGVVVMQRVMQLPAMIELRRKAGSQDN